MNHTKNFGFSRKCGILMPISSLPSPYGIGNFGKGAYDFIDFLDATNQKCWQVLPLNPTSYGDSPYQSPASSAGNPYFIDPEILFSEGLITKDELLGARDDSVKIKYGKLFFERYPLLRLAHSRFSPNGTYRAFCKKCADWLTDYALFMALKTHYSYKPWTLWEDEHKNASVAREHMNEFSEEMEFWKWVQYEFTREWQGVLNYAHKKGISIIGDMPIYVAHDSVDVWSTS